MSKKKKVWNLLDNVAGDKVVWIITLMLILLSVVCVFSSSSRLLKGDMTRLDIVADQLKVVGIGLGIIIFLYNIRKIAFFRFFSQFGFIVSIILLFILDIGGIGPIEAPKINGAVRFLKIGAFQVHIFEIVKVAMVMYLSWAVDRFKNGGFKFTKELSKIRHLEWVNSPLGQQVIFIYIPFLATTVGVLPGSNTAALFIAATMVFVILIGIDSWKVVGTVVAIGVIGLGSCFGLYQATKHNSHPMFERIGTGVMRMLPHNYERDYELAANSDERQQALDKLRQTYSARMAIQQGGIIGKGPGQSTQRYVVPDMSADFMFSFILEEYGFLGGLLVLVLYVSLMARGVLIVKNCGKNVFAKCTIAGLTFLITGQAMLHMVVNCDIGILTGQTLPLLSHGASAFICFSIAFGVILSISRIANKGIARATKDAEHLIELNDTVQAGLQDLDYYESLDTEIESENDDIQETESDY